MRHATRITRLGVKGEHAVATRSRRDAFAEMIIYLTSKRHVYDKKKDVFDKVLKNFSLRDNGLRRKVVPTEEFTRTSAILVTRADQDAAAMFTQRVAMMNWVILQRVINSFREGGADEYGLSHIMAHHRRKAEREAKIEGARLALSTAAQLVRMASGVTYGYSMGNLQDIESLIENLSPEEVAAGHGGIAAMLTSNALNVPRFA